MEQEQTPLAPPHSADPLQIPARLYGRTHSLVALQGAFEHACLGHGSVLLVPGNSGSGKTSLVRAIRGEVESRNGLFLEGKFNQYHQNVPYFAIRGILSEFCRELARDDRASREAWKDRLLDALGGLGQLLIDMAPELETLLGQQPSVADINPLEARHRFAGVLGDFLRVLCRPEHPVVLFLDDMQWADVASAELLTRLRVGSALRYLLVVASYRDEEVDSGHPLIKAVEELRRQSVPVDELAVANLTEPEVRELLADTLQLSGEHAESLTLILHRRTGGNPFFVRSLLAALAEQGLLRYDQARRAWRWSLEELGRGQLPTTIVDLFADKIHHLAPETAELLSLAACLGSQFELAFLAMISERSPAACRRLLRPAVDGGLLLSLDALADANEYRFLHDRVQQAAYGLIPAADLPRFRLQVGRRLRAQLRDEQLSDRLFQVVDHLNAGLALIDAAHEQVEMVRLNTRAARKARSATAYRAALTFHRAAAEYLDQPGFAQQLWTAHHDLAQQYFLDRAETEFLEGDRQLAEQCVRQAVTHATSVIEKAEALNTLILQFTLLARYPEAIAAGREGLAALGIELPEADYEAARDAELAEVRAALRDRRVAELAELPEMSHPEMRTAVKLLITMGPPCYRSHQRLWSVLVTKVVNLTIRFGNLPQVGYSHTAFGGLVGWVANDYALTKEFGELATQLMTDEFDSPSDRSVFYLMIGSSVRHWCESLRASSRDYAQAYEIGLASGNLQYAAYAFGHNMYCRLYQGTPLAELIQESVHSLEFSRTRLNQWAIDLLAGGLKIMAGLRSSGAGPDADPDWEREYLEQVTARHNIQVECIYKVNRAFALLMLGDHERALGWSDQAEPLLYTVGTQGLLPWAEHVFVRALILARLIPGAAAERQAAWRDEFARLSGQIRIWADACPENFAHKRAFLAAEAAVLDGRWTTALRRYREAAASAAAESFLHWEGLAHERAAELLEARGQGRLAQSYWQDACRCYDQWGAAVKLAALESAYQDQLHLDLPEMPAADACQEASELEFRRELQDEHQRQLRTKAAWTRRARLEEEVHRQAGELAEAMNRLQREVVERRRVEQALTKLNAELEQRVLERTAEALDLYHHAPCGYHSLGRDGLVLQMNDTELKWLGYASEEVIGRLRISDLMTLRSAAEFEEELPGLMASAAPWTMEWDMQAKDGSDVAFLVNGQTVWDADGRFPMIRGTVVNITGRRGAELQMRKFKSVVEQGPISVLITDTNGTIEYVNPQFTRHTGYAAAEILGKNPRILKSGVHPREFYERLWSTLLRGNTWRGELCNRRKDGALNWQLAVIAPLRDHTGQITNFVYLQEDITERRLVAEELRQAKDTAEKANQAKTTFLANMSHEIRTPMNAILGFAQLLLADPTLSPERRQHLSTIRRSGDHLLQIINDILELARIESGRAQLKLGTFHLPLLLDDIQQMFQLRAEDKDLQFRIARPSVLPEFVVGDETKLRQVIINLLGNACKFTPRGGQIELRVRTAAEPEGKLRLYGEVEDNGPGIAPEDLARLFEPFYQTPSGRLAGGTGLGLAISHGVVQLMGGQLAASSQLDRGSTFRFDVQLAPGEPVAIVPRAQVLRLRPGVSCRVLVVDDQAENRELAAQLLTPLGFTIRLAEDGAVAVAQCQSWSPHVVLLDLRMPVMDGHEAARQIRAAHGSAIKIIALSAGAFAENEQDALAAGADAFLTKPFLVGDLLEQIKRLTGVEYDYADRPPDEPSGPQAAAGSTPAVWDLSKLPPGLIQPLLEATSTADYSRLLELIEQVRTLDGPLASQLHKLASRFDYPAVQAILSAPPTAGAGGGGPVGPGAKPTPKRILIAEDSRDIQRLLKLVLTTAGLDVDVADDGQQACRLAQDARAAGRPYDLILMDMQMPVLDGLAATKRLREEGWQAPIVALTGQVQDEDRQRCLAAGCNDYLCKPVARPELLRTVTRYAGPPG